MITIDKVIDEIFQFPIEDQEIIANIINKRIIEEKRELIYNDYKNAMNDYKDKKITKGTIDDLFKVIKK